MNLLKLPFRLIGGLWNLAMRVRNPLGSDLRHGSAAAGLYTFLFLFFALVAVVALTLGISLESIDRWIEANGGWIEALGDLTFRAVWALVFLFSVLTCLAILFGAVSALRGPASPEVVLPEDAADGPEEQAGPLGLGCGFLVALTLGYFSWFGMIG